MLVERVCVVVVFTVEFGQGKVVEVKTVECSKIDSCVLGIVRLSEANNSIGCTRILPR